jgi:hypothetical protein
MINIFFIFNPVIGSLRYYNNSWVGNNGIKMYPAIY